MNRMSQTVLSLALAIGLCLAAGCGKKPDDAKISSDIQSKFSQDSGLSSKQLTVQADHGIVTLSGNVDSDAQRDAASRQAASVEGVKTVVNNLRVENAAALATSVPPAKDLSAPVKHSEPDSRAKKASASVNRKAKKARVSKNSDAVDQPADNSNANDMTASNTPAADTPPAITEIPPTDAAPARTIPPPPAGPKKLIIDQGTQLAVRLIDPIDSEKNQTGDTFHATLNAPLTSDGEQAVPAGIELTGHLVDVKSAGKFAGQSVVVLQLDSLSSGGKTYSLQTDQYRKEGKSRGKNTAEKVGGGAILGGIIGAIAGGGKGAAIGTAAGAGVGGGAQAASKSQQIKLPSETVLNFTLQAPITVVQVLSPDANRPKLPDAPK